MVDASGDDDTSPIVQVFQVSSLLSNIYSLHVPHTARMKLQSYLKLSVQYRGI